MTVHTMQVDLVGGPDDGLLADVLFGGHGTVTYRGHKYIWRADDTGWRYLWYVGEAPPIIAPLIHP